MGSKTKRWGYETVEPTKRWRYETIEPTKTKR